MENVGSGSNGNDCFDFELDAKDVWPVVVEQFLIDLMIEEVGKGNMRTTTLTRSGWCTIKKGLKEKFNKEYTDEQLKNKHNQLRQRQRNFSSLISEAGVHYNIKTGQVTASHEVWDKLTKVHKMRLRFRKRGCPEFPKLCIIFGETTALEAAAAAATKSVSNGTNDDPTSNEQNKGINVEVISHESEGGGAGAGDHGNESSSRNSDADCIMKCVKIMDDLEIEGSAFGRALQALHDSPLYRELFLRMSNKRRKEWAVSLK